MIYCLFYNQYYYLWLYDLSHVSFGGYLVAGLYRKFLQLDNSSFCYYERPAPFPDQHKATTVLLLHGFTANKTMWMVVSKFLPKDWRIVVLDLPGHGESSFTPDGNYSAFGLAQKLHEVSSPPLLTHTHTHTHILCTGGNWMLSIMGSPPLWPLTLLCVHFNVWTILSFVGETSCYSTSGGQMNIYQTASLCCHDNHTFPAVWVM